MARSSAYARRLGSDAAWLAVLAMFCQLLAPVLSSQHHAVMAYELAQATGGYCGHHGDEAPAGDPAGCVVHMALHAASSPLASPPPPLPVRLGSKIVRPTLGAHVIATVDRQWRPQAVRAPPEVVASMN